MKLLLSAAIAAIATSSFSEHAHRRLAPVEQETHIEEHEYHPEDDGVVDPYEIDPARRSLMVSAKTTEERRKLTGEFGLCTDGLTVENGDLVCDPANALPQLCALQCWPGHYQVGRDSDVSCADAMCIGDCQAEVTTVVTQEARVVEKKCEYQTYEPCDTNPSGFCEKFVSENCSTTEFVDVETQSCTLRESDDFPGTCKSSGCSGKCDQPGNFFYYSEGCPEMCPPWRDPEVPDFRCAPCQEPDLSAVPANLDARLVDGFLRIGCAPGYFGTEVQRIDCAYNGGVYIIPTLDTSAQCKKCADVPQPTSANVEVVVTEGTADAPGSVSYACKAGFEGEATTASCDGLTGNWPALVEPVCTRVEPSPSAEVAAPSSAATSSPSSAATSTPTATQTPSKTPRPPKTLGSRAPSASAKAVGSAAPVSGRTTA